jgi:hypothetical protein
MADHDLRAQLAKILDWKEAHAGFDKSIDGLPIRSRGLRAPGLPHSVWELVEHIRIAQQDILSFCRDEQYKELEWPLAYWPAKPMPADAQAWDDSVVAYHRDVEALKAMAVDPAIDLFARVPRGTGQTYLRELLLVADHTSYHVGQIVDVRQALGVWNP